VNTQVWLDAIRQRGVKVQDLRGQLPVNHDRSFGVRSMNGLHGLALHHTAARGADLATLEAVARYHAGANHISPKGCPGLCYTGAVLGDGTLCLAWGLETATWSQGGQVPGANSGYIGLLVMGDFKSAENTDGHDPTPEQWDAVLRIWQASAVCWGWGQGALRGHFQFGKPSCPGDVLRYLVLAVQAGRQPVPPALVPDMLPDNPSTRQMQQALLDLGYDPGGVDGSWGPCSRTALARFQADQRLVVDGAWGPATQDRIEALLARL